MNPLIELKKTAPVLLITLALLCFGLLPRAQAVSPPPPGGYPNFTTAAGDHALQALTLGVGNTALGTFSLFSVTTGSFNTAVGAASLDLNTADSNTATGAAALLFNTTGTQNTANGTAALEFNDTGDFNTATGAFALFSNTTGALNTANGAGALLNNTTGSSNTATGFEALLDNTTGQSNTANGNLALENNTTGGSNTAIGVGALRSNTIGDFNTANGTGALISNTTGNGNTAIGDHAGSNQTIGNNNVYIGQGMAGVAGENNTCYIRSIFGQISADGVPVLVNGDNKLGTNASSKRFKEDIKSMDKASEALLALKPVTFRYRKEIDPHRTPQFGLVAEEVEKVDPALIVRDKEGKPYSVRYDQVNAMLLNEFLKEHRKNAEQQATIVLLKSTDAKQEATIAKQQKQIEALTAGLQRVSAQVELNKLAPQTVKNDD